MPDTPPSPHRIGVREFRENLTGYLRQARQGSAFLVTSRGQVVAELRPPPVEERPRRQPGALKGKIWIADDFDETPEWLIDAMEGKAG